MHNSTATITQLNDENQEMQVIENYKEKLRSYQEKNLEKEQKLEKIGIQEKTSKFLTSKLILFKVQK